MAELSRGDLLFEYVHELAYELGGEKPVSIDTVASSLRAFEELVLSTNAMLAEVAPWIDGRLEIGFGEQRRDRSKKKD